MLEDETFRDALTEMVNIGVGRAAASLATMVKERIELSVPRLVTIPYHELPTQLGIAGKEMQISIVQQPFEGGVGGTASILFPLESARHLVSLLTNGELSAEELDLEMEAALTEVGNILINSVLGTLGNVAGVEIVFHLPQYSQRPAQDLEQGFQCRELLLAMVLIGISGQEICGHMIVLFDLESLAALRESVYRITDS